jgi:hypothetical protein
MFPNRVLFLGAGASMPADYPSTLDLIPEVLEAAEVAAAVHVVDALKAWRTAVQGAADVGLDQDLLAARNPEITLSYLDVIAQARDEAPLDYLDDVFKRGAPPDPSVLNKWRQPRLDLAERARRALRTLLTSYFLHRLWDDSQHVPKFAYLGKILGTLGPGDVVITLNWDAAVELVLADEGRWNPIDGYGPRHESVRVTSPARCVLPSSEVTVLKLHGGIGLKAEGGKPDDVYLSYAHLLQYLPVKVRGAGVLLEQTGGPDGFNVEPFDEVLIIPSYLKRVAHGRYMREVWQLADVALRTAKEIEVWGYGLPESDGEVRLLLSSLRPRLEAGAVRVAVHDPKADARVRWRELLGVRAQVDDRKLEKTETSEVASAPA